MIIHHMTAHPPRQGEEVSYFMESTTCNTNAAELDNSNYD